MTAKLTIKGKTYNTPNRYAIAPYLEELYCNNDVLIQDKDGIVEKFVEQSCPGCGRDYVKCTQPKNAERPIILCCNNRDVNHHFGYVLPVCLDCYYYMQWINGQPVPKTIREKLETNWIPSKIWDLI